jgi:ribosomal protein L20A (L18A)
MSTDLSTLKEATAEAQAKLEHENVQQVYEEIASHFSATRYKVDLFYLILDS